MKSKCNEIAVCPARDANRCDMRCEQPSVASAGYDRAKELEICLRTLVALKQEKDCHGKTDYYMERMPLAWEEARRLVGA